MWLLDHTHVTYITFTRRTLLRRFTEADFRDMFPLQWLPSIIYGHFKGCDQVASAAVTRNSTKAMRLANKASIFRAELYAITLAMDFIRRCKNTKFIVFSDSMSSLEALNVFKIEVDLVLKIIKDYTSLIRAGKVIEFCWIPSHMNIADNKRADTAGKFTNILCFKRTFCS